MSSHFTSGLFRGRSFAAATAVGLLLAGPALAQQMEPLEDGFPNRPIVLLVIDEPGSADSVYANQIADAATRLSPQPVVVEHRVDFTNFGTWEGIAWIRDQGEIATDGYINYVLTLPDAMVDMAALDIESMTGQSQDALNPVIATERVPFFLVQRADAPWGDTVEEFVAYAQENPDSVRHITGGPGGGMDAAIRFWANGLDFTVRDVIAGNPTERALAVASGEGDITALPPDVLRPHFDAGRMELLMGAGEGPFGAPWEDVPSAASMGIEDDPFSQTRTIATAPEVSDEHRQWLYELFSAAAQDEDYIAQREQVAALELIDLDPEEATALADEGLEVSIQIFRDLGMYWGDQ
ncbi:Bug family tripartite tricarboxylate transporter substrate binding protein [Pelagibacterium montanilacus]|uniref:Bug family tripartite tricarboxylate transporter substrate binding protein n=1 Tax=Pelagibacterium montanilacus TaxID=2185280 RepID=UPI0013E086B3|nr:tripartite tricarboxylate transporter substrate-binding protein [Pelagibacterium montanilacus]